jgi:hypothetical protein
MLMIYYFHSVESIQSINGISKLIFVVETHTEVLPGVVLITKQVDICNLIAVNPTVIFSDYYSFEKYLVVSF